jgi:hypothetical protein
MFSKQSKTLNISKHNSGVQSIPDKRTITNQERSYQDDGTRYHNRTLHTHATPTSHNVEPIVLQAPENNSGTAVSLNDHSSQQTPCSNFKEMQ